MAKQPKQSPTRTTFEKVGNNIAATVGNGQSARPQRGKLVQKGNSKGGGMLEAATATHRANVQERQGPKFKPQVALYAPNAASASETQRNTRIVPSAVGNRDFYLKRQYGQVQQ